MGNLSESLRQEARELGLCDKWYNEWGECGQQELIDKFVKGIDFCLDRAWPSPEFIKGNFDPCELRENLIFVDEDLDMHDAPDGIYILNGECSGTLRFGSWAAATIYVRHTSKVMIIAEDFARVFVRVYDDAEAETIGLDDAVVKVYDRR